MATSGMDRLAAIWRSNVNQLLERLEDPEKMARQALRDMEEAVEQAVGELARALARQRGLEREEAQTRDAVQVWEQKAAAAMERGEEDYARLALRKRLELESALTDVDAALGASRQTVVELRAQLDAMRERLQQAQRRQGTLAAKARQARAAGPDLGQEPAGDTAGERLARLERRIAGHTAELARYEEQVDAVAAEAELYRELTADTRTERELAQIDAAQRVDAELAALRERVRPKG